MDKKPVRVRISEANLSKANYNFDHHDQNDSYQISFEDIVVASNFTNDSFELVYTRKSTTKEPFQFVVEFIVKVNDVNTNDLEANQEQIKDFAERKKIDIVNKLILPARASLLISNITRESSGAFVTIPTYFEAKKN